MQQCPTSTSRRCTPGAELICSGTCARSPTPTPRASSGPPQWPPHCSTPIVPHTRPANAELSASTAQPCHRARLTTLAPAYPRVLDELLPTACQVMEQYANNAIEADHGRLKSRLRPMRSLTRLRSARVISAGHAFVQTSAVVTTTSPLTSSRAVSSVKQRPPVARRTDTTGGVSRSAGQRATGLVVSCHVFLSLGHVFDDTQIKIRR